MNEKYMEMALDLAYQGIGNTSPNPSVGAVLVKNNRIISTGFTQPAGSDHAEVIAIKNASEPIHGSELYVTLEPCCHHGKTPACSHLIVQSGIKKIYTPIHDPNPKVCGNGIQDIIDAGLEAEIVDEYHESAYDLLRPFFKSIINKRTYIVHKCAVTLDGKIATHSYDSKWISNDYSRYIVHKLRTKVDAIIIGKNTLIQDNPTLNVRLDSFGKEVQKNINKDANKIGKNNFFVDSLLFKNIVTARNPLRVIIGVPDGLHKDMNIFFDDNFLFFDKQKEVENLSSKNTYINDLIAKEKIIAINTDDNIVMIDEMLKCLYNKGIMYGLLEGGSRLAGSFFESGHIDQYFYTIAPKVLGSGISPLNGIDKLQMDESKELKQVSIYLIRDDMIYSAYTKNRE